MREGGKRGIHIRTQKTFKPRFHQAHVCGKWGRGSSRENTHRLLMVAQGRDAGGVAAGAERAVYAAEQQLAAIGAAAQAARAHDLTLLKGVCTHRALCQAKSEWPFLPPSYCPGPPPTPPNTSHHVCEVHTYHVTYLLVCVDVVDPDVVPPAHTLNINGGPSFTDSNSKREF